MNNTHPLSRLSFRINRILFDNQPCFTPQRRWVGNFQGSSISLWLASLTQPESGQHNRLKVMVTRDQNQLNQLETELAFCGINAYVFPDWETLIYDDLSPHQDIISERVHLLTKIPQKGILLINVQTLMQRVAPKQWLLGQHFDLSVGDRFDIQQQSQELTKIGYHIVDNVFEPGEFAVRGSVVDLFPIGQAFPVRLDLLDDEIDSIRFFNPKTQRSLTAKDLDELRTHEPYLYQKFIQQQKQIKYIKNNASGKIQCFQVLPAKEFPLEKGKETFRKNFASQFAHVSTRNVEIFNDVMNGIAAVGIEYYQPLFFENDLWQQDSEFFNYLPKDSLFILDNQYYEVYKNFWQQIQQRYKDRCHNITKPILEPDQLYLVEDVFNQRIASYFRILISEEPISENRAGALNTQAKTPPILTINHRLSEPLQLLLDFMQSCTKPILLVAETPGRREVVKELLKGKVQVQLVHDLVDFLQNYVHLVEEAPQKQLALTVAPIERGAWVPENFVIISETQLFGRQILQTRRQRQSDVSDEFLIKSISELKIGDAVVHIDYGIGRYQGLSLEDNGHTKQEMIQLMYDDAQVYVSMSELRKISRYTMTDASNAPLHKISRGKNTKWARAKEKVLQQINDDVAVTLLSAQAQREAKKGIRFSIDQLQYDIFASQFAFEETPDQANAISAVIHDMKQDRPMDRLVCGDVGFGKTEVAMRAAFIAVHAGYQVAILVPTTLLAGQHTDNFHDRFADWAVNIKSLSRFGTKKQHSEVLQGLQDGSVDIVIGTHRLLQEDIKFAKLGLMIVDEEHRFGVKDKERIKAMQTNIDILSMTATPIPRTLSMALSGMRDMSIIGTAPDRRLPIKTFVMQKTDNLLKEAILRELLRGGQVYLLHNNVASINNVAEAIKKLLPEARVAIAHGQMKERELEQVMQAFYHRKHNVLVCTTIIETGIDIPNANTIIIERADRFGLAQLHQLRGRVGRSHHQAYCYLLVPSLKTLTSDAERRLEAISRANTLGSGYMLASEDLEIRGAGELLGKQQSGNMQTIGFSLYMDMLNHTINTIKSGKALDIQVPFMLNHEVRLGCSALIPSDYLADVHQRLLFYQRLNTAKNSQELINIRSEMIDRFGQLPEYVKNLLETHELRLLAESLLILKIDANQEMVSFEFSENTPVNPISIIKLIQQNPSRYYLEKNTTFKVVDKQKLAELANRIEFIRELLKYFQENRLNNN